MIQYVDQFVIDNVTSLLQGTLNNSYIIKEDILKDLPTDIVDSFIDTYSSDTGKGKSIPVKLTFPSNPTGETFILAQFESSVEDPEDAPLGMLEGVAVSQAEGDVIQERALVQVDTDNNAYIELSNTPYKIQGIKETNGYTFTKGQSKVTIPYISPYSSGEHYLHVLYSVYKKDSDGNEIEDVMVNQFGSNSTEGVSLDVCSTNIDTLRCLHGIIYNISIYLKHSLQNNYNIILPQLKVSSVDLMTDFNGPSDSVNGQRYYTRRYELSYKVTQTITPKAGFQVDTLNINYQVKG